MAVFFSEEKPPVDVKGRIIQGLVQGKAVANQLQTLLRDLGHDGSGVLVHELADKILGSFTTILSELGSQHPQPKHARLGTEFRNKKRSVESGVRRGCYKRRKSSQTRTTVASTTVDDQTWRKYGQKQILNSKYPRSYFRCTHKYDRNCKAVKQVQKMGENPLTYEITYIGVHTCMDGRKAPPPQFSEEDTTPLREIQPFDALSNSNTPDIKEDTLFSVSPPMMTALALKEEAKEDAKSDITDIEIDSLLMEAGDLAEGSSIYEGFGMNFLMNSDGSEVLMFDH